jgi:hypothetical protein
MHLTAITHLRFGKRLGSVITFPRMQNGFLTSTAIGVGRDADVIALFLGGLGFSILVSLALSRPRP